MKDIKKAYLQEKVSIKCVYFFLFWMVKNAFPQLINVFATLGSILDSQLI